MVEGMRRLSEVMNTHCGLDEADRKWLNSLAREWHLFADTSFSDLVLWLPDASDENVFWAGAQIRPTTGPTALQDDVVGEEIRYEPDSMVTAAYLSHEIMETSDNNLGAGIPVDTWAIPIIRHNECIAVIDELAPLPGDPVIDKYAYGSFHGTDLDRLYRQGAFQVLELSQYLELVGDCLKLLPPETVIHRLTGDGAKRELVAPLWSADKKRVINAMTSAFDNPSSTKALAAASFVS